jgi:hypothetical protein
MREKNFVVLVNNNDRWMFNATFISGTCVISCIKRRMRLNEKRMYSLYIVVTELIRKMSYTGLMWP